MTVVAQISDLHLRPRGAPCYRVVETNMLAERAVDALLALDPRPDAVVVTGDIGQSGDPRGYAVARDVLARLPMPVYILSGNHDDSKIMKPIFADFPGMDQGPADRLYFCADIGPLHLIALDSSVLKAGHGELGGEQIAWLDQALAQASDRPTIVALHHPPIDVGVAHMDRINLTDADAFGAVIARHSNVHRIICGHDHRPIFASFAGTMVTVAPSVAHQVVLDLRPDAPSAFNMEPAAYLLHYWNEKSGLVTHTAYVERADGPFPFAPAEGVSW